MKPEILAEIQRRSAEQKRMIESGEIMVCNSAKPMPRNRDQMGQKWFHESAYPVKKLSNTEQLYLCRACGLEFPVTRRKIVPHAR